MLSRKFLQYHCHRTTSLCKLFFTTRNSQKEPTVEDSTIKKVRNSNRYVSKEVCEYIINHSGIEDIRKFMPRRALHKRCSRSSTLYLINRETAKDFASMISEDLLKDASFVIECNPGLGLLTQELLNIGVPQINLFEKIDSLVSKESPLSSLLNKYKSRLNLTLLNFNDVWMTCLYDDHTYDGVAKKYLHGIPKLKWTKKTCAQIIIASPARAVITLMMYNFYRQTEIFQYGRLCFYLMLPSQVWNNLLVRPNEGRKRERFYTHYNVMLDLFFDYKSFGELPRKDFVPWPTKKKQDDFVAVKIEPKLKAFNLVEKEDLKPLWYFLKHCLRTRFNRVISEMEKLSPGCGSKLIVEQDIDFCTTFKELPPQRLLKLFLFFKSLPDYDENIFVPISLNADDENVSQTAEDSALSDSQAANVSQTAEDSALSDSQAANVSQTAEDSEIPDSSQAANDSQVADSFQAVDNSQKEEKFETTDEHLDKSEISYLEERKN